MNKKLLVILGISLAVNFVFIGFEAAKAIYQPAFPDIPPLNVFIETGVVHGDAAAVSVAA